MKLRMRSAALILSLFCAELCEAATTILERNGQVVQGDIQGQVAVKSLTVPVTQSGKQFNAVFYVLIPGANIVDVGAHDVAIKAGQYNLLTLSWDPSGSSQPPSDLVALAQAATSLPSGFPVQFGAFSSGASWAEVAVQASASSTVNSMFTVPSQMFVSSSVPAVFAKPTIGQILGEYTAANGGALSGLRVVTSSGTVTLAASDITDFGNSSPALTAVVNGASFSPGIVSGSWVTITGTNLSSVTDTWDKSIVNGQLPTLLDGISVSIGGRPAYVYYVSPGQINAQVPDVGLGPMPVTVTNGSVTSTAFTATVQQFAPAFFLWSGKYAVATHQNFSVAAKAGLFSGLTTIPAKPGDVIILWGTGFGPVIPAVAAGIQVPADTIHSTASSVSVTIGNSAAQVYGTALAPGYAGLYQVAIQIPASTPDGDIPIKASIGGVQSPDSVFITVQH